ncbi:hypothetical protein BU25DRAFT_473747 [Macroventuria anomochaeta]|uniref:Uncharacterized protein n=1 Tax=Macroventuria anomochaeta TaxID=301207 RepID=A0ACB6RTI7_9PLEO|nr:uncharacterized protein BU25DRAFT_473747 [Macroventuria anomochaeta]KAF2625216.1 hypothetical protein BU25DRAFT_473747 [Macroventuria anomochaeta]
MEKLFEVASTLGVIDVLVQAAGSTTTGVVGDLEPKAQSKDYKLARHAQLPEVLHDGMSIYSGRKLAFLKLVEFREAERPDLRVFTVHLGSMVVTETNCGAMVDASTPFAKDKGIQTGGLSLYLAQKRADYLRGSFISVNWDVTEMGAHQEEIKEQKLLKLAFLGAKLEPDGHPWSS